MYWNKKCSVCYVGGLIRFSFYIKYFVDKGFYDENY